MKIVKDYTVISPAYGRDYTKKKDAEEAFMAGVDFVMESLGFGGKYCSVRDFAPGVKVQIYYANMRKSIIVTTKS